MARKLFEDSWEIPNTSWTLDEGVDEAGKKTGTVDGVNILARAVGPFFLVDAASRNGRYYSRKLWETAIEKTRALREAGQMLGTIGHEQILDDNALRDGKASHRVSDIWIDEKRKIGMGEIFILNTPAGRILNAMLRGGVFFPVSSRAFGEYKGKKEGHDYLDPESYSLECFDFVRTPGVAAAHAKIVESLDISNDDTPQTIPPDEDYDMPDAQALQQIAEAKAQLQVELNSALDQNKSLLAKVEAHTTVKETLESRIAELSSKLEQLKKESAELTAQLETYKELGTAEVLEKVLDSSEELSGAVAGLGTIAQLEELTSTLEDLLQPFSGNREALQEYVDSYEAYKELGTPTALGKALDILSEYADLGDPDAISKAFDMAEQVAEQLVSVRQEDDAALLVEKYGLPESTAAKLLSKMGIADAEQVAEDLCGDGDLASRYKLDEDAGDNPQGEAKRRSPVSETRVSRLFSTQTKARS